MNQSNIKLVSINYAVNPNKL